MDDNLKDIIKFAEEHDGELVIDSGNEIVRLVGFMTDDEDYYWHIREIGYYCKERYSSCVGRLILLKGSLPHEDYEEIEHTFFLNTEINQKRLHFYDKWESTDFGKIIKGSDNA